jgi:hypothetical protein
VVVEMRSFDVARRSIEILRRPESEALCRPANPNSALKKGDKNCDVQQKSVGAMKHVIEGLESGVLPL